MHPHTEHIVRVTLVALWAREIVFLGGQASVASVSDPVRGRVNVVQGGTSRRPARTPKFLVGGGELSLAARTRGRQIVDEVMGVSGGPLLSAWVYHCGGD